MQCESSLHFSAVCPDDDSAADLDFYQVSLENRRLFFNTDDLLDILIGLCGEMVTISSSSNIRSGAEKNFPDNPLILAYHPVIISNSPTLKSSLISSTALGLPLLPWQLHQNPRQSYTSYPYQTVQTTFAWCWSRSADPHQLRDEDSTHLLSSGPLPTTTQFYNIVISASKF